jgi:hypothetical protein
LDALVPVVVADHARHRKGVDHEEAKHVPNRRVDDFTLEICGHGGKGARNAAARALASPRRSARVEPSNQSGCLEVLVWVEWRKQRGDRSGRRVLS